MKRFFALLVGLVAASTALSSHADWPQWRGPDRSGYVSTGPLVTELPAEGLKPSWKLDSFVGGNSGGWSSPVISGDRVFIFSHTKVKDPLANLEEKKYPWLAPEKRTGMTDEEYAEYEVKRRNEDERRAKAYRFDQRLVCLNLDSGEVIWNKTTEGVYSRFVQSGTPCVVDGRVYVLGSGRVAFCHDAETGEILWQKRLPGEFRDEHFSSSFAVAGKTALVACGPLYALSSEDGQVLWADDEPSDYNSHSSPVVWQAGNAPIAIYNAAGGRTKAFDVATGKLLWELNSGVGRSTPIVTGDLLLTYGSSRKSGLTAYQMFAGSPEKAPEQKWQFRGAADSGSTPVLRGDAVFVQGDKRVAKVRLSDGDTVWQKTLRISNPRYTSLIAAGDQVFYGWEGLLAFDANAEDFQQIYDAEIDGEGRLIGGDDLRKKLELQKLESGEAEKVWQQKAIKSGPLACSTPAVSDGRMVIRLRNSLICYDLRK